MKAQDLFSRGDRVRPSALGIERLATLRRRPGVRGTVVGFSNDGTCIRVKADDYTSVQSFSADFWEKDTTP